MSVAQPFFPSETNEILNPQFTKALKGFSTDEVLDYVALVRRRIESLEESLETATQERNASRAQVADAKHDAYRKASDRLAGILQRLDEHIEGVRLQADDEAARRVHEATEAADVVIREAREAAEAMRWEALNDARLLREEAASVLGAARAEAADLLAGLEDRRSQLSGELASIRHHLLSIADSIVLVEGDHPTMEAEAGSEGSERVIPAGEWTEQTEPTEAGEHADAAEGSKTPVEPLEPADAADAAEGSEAPLEAGEPIQTDEPEAPLIDLAELELDDDHLNS